MVTALQRELQLRKDQFANEVVQTIYFGGGTPSVLTPEEIRAITDTVYQNYQVTETPEITLEANPDDLTNNKGNTLSTFEGAKNLSTGRNRSDIFQAYKEIGIDRLSIGIQSFFEEDLKFMNRAHSASEAEKCLTEAVRYFDNISIDLIYGVPGMDHDRWKENIEKALSFGIPHISSYALTVEPNTALASFIKKGNVQPLDDEMAEAHYHILTDTLTKAGFICYEISNFGKPGYFSQNNTAYWQGKKYIGIGPSAHSYDGRNRSWNVRNNTKYVRAISENKLPSGIETLTKTDRYNEDIMTGLRTIWGVSLLKIESEYGVKYKEYALRQADKYIKQQLLSLTDNTLMTTEKGRFLADGIAADLFMVNLS